MKKIYLLLAFMVMLGGCGLTKKDLGMTRPIPDETQVVTREKLVVPPDYAIRPERVAE